MNAFKILESRGFLEQSTNFDELEKKFANEKIVFYTGFDPTADSLTVGHFIPIMAMSHLQRAGHLPAERCVLRYAARDRFELSVLSHPAGVYACALPEDRHDLRGHAPDADRRRGGSHARHGHPQLGKRRA